MGKQWKILEPIQLGNKICRNRIIMGAHSYGYVDDNGLPTDSLVDYVAERAKGGVGAIIIGGSAIFSEWDRKIRIICNLNDDIIPRYEKIANEVHKYGALVLDQLFHAGGQLESSEGVRIAAPSAIPHERINSIPTELSSSEIKDAIELFASAAGRAKRGGLDGVEIKCDQGYLIHQFLSPYYNRREDEYGGSYEKRLKFLFEVITRVREIVDKDFIVGLRITGDSMTRGDLILQEVIRIVKDVESTTNIDYINVNGATNSTYRGYWVSHADSSIEQMNFAPLARAIKAEVGVPIIASSMILHPEEAEFLLESGACDLVSMTRAHIADAEIVDKVIKDKLEDIRPCVLCNQGCVRNHHNYSDVRCIHNAATGRERELGVGTIVKAEKKKKIAVVGGGPAGLEFARIAAMRGHILELFEKNKYLGGQLHLAGKFPYRQGLLDIIHFLEGQVKRYDVKIHLSAEVTQEDLLAMKEDFDAVVLATGAELYVPPIYEDVDPGSILPLEDLFVEDDFSSERVADNVLIVDADWRRNALAIAELLAQRGRTVSMISSDYLIGANIDVVTRTLLRAELIGGASLG